MKRTALIILLVLPLSALAATRAGSPSTQARRECGVESRDENHWPVGVRSHALATLAVAHEGRVMILDTRARQLLARICGRRQLDGEEPVATILDLIARPAAVRRPLIYINYLPLKQRILDHLPVERRKKLLPRKVLLSADDISRNDLAAVMHEAFRSGDAKMRDAVIELRETLELLNPDQLMEELLIVPPARGVAEKRWASVATIRSNHPAFAQWLALVEAFRDKDASAVNAAAGELAERLDQLNVSSARPSQAVRDIELFYNRSGKMTSAFAVYLAAAVLFLAGGLFGKKWIGAIGQVALTGAILMHAGFFAMRAIVAGHLPLTNMYESLLLAAWVVAAVALIVHRLKAAKALPLWAIGSAGAFVAALLCLLTNFVGIGQGEIGPRTALLRSAWLTYHVITIMIGYAFILLSFVVSIVYLLMRCRRTPKDLPAVDRANVILVRLAFLFVLGGILTGSVWADVAWGRWWGWDAKETMSLVTLLVYTLLLHVRLFAKDKGLVTAILSIVGVVSTAMTWFGVNYLIRGSLHSYV